MKKILKIFNKVFCWVCGKHSGSVGNGLEINGMCERCYENEGDDE